MSPTSTFEKKDGTTTTFMEYYKNRYGLDIQEVQQPLLMFRDKKDDTRTGFLVPELCYMTGLTDRQRNDFRLMKTIATVTKLNAQDKNNEIGGLIKRLHEEERPKEIMKDQRITVEAAPIQLSGFRLEAGRMILGKNNQVKVEDNRDLDRQVQAELLEQRPLNTWAVFYNNRDQRVLESFMDTLKQSIDTFAYVCNLPKVVAVNGNRFE